MLGFHSVLCNVLVLATLFLLGCAREKAAPVDSSRNATTTPEVADNLDLEAGELYVQLSPADGFLHIKEYLLSTRKSDATEIQSQVEKISELVRTARYSHTRFGLSAFTAMEESMSPDRDFITVECKLLTKERDLYKIMGNVYSGLLRRPVTITISKEDIGLHYEGPDIDVRTNNAQGVYRKDDRRIIFWRNGERHYQAVFARHGSTPADFHSLQPYIKEAVASPEKSEEEIAKWRATQWRATK